AAGQDLDESAELLDRCDLPFVDLADADLFTEGIDLGLGSSGAGGVAMRDKDRAVVLDVDLGAGRFLDALDHLAARADQEANLLWIDLDRQQPRRPRARLGTREAERGDDRLENLAAGIAGLVERGADDLGVDAVDLEVELDAGDAADGAGNL